MIAGYALELMHMYKHSGTATWTVSLGPQIPGNCAIIHSSRTELQNRTGSVITRPVQPELPPSGADALPPTTVSLSEEQRAIVDLAKDRKPLIVGGGPGTGKSALVAHLVRALEGMGRRVQVVSTTGIAGRPHNASTLHAWLKLGLADRGHQVELDAVKRLSSAEQARLKAHYARPNTLIVEEGSMLNDDLLTLMYEVIWDYFEIDLQPIGAPLSLPHFHKHRYECHSSIIKQ